MDHSYEELLCQRIFQIACGYEDANDCDSLRHDPEFKAACNRLPISGDPLASQPTMSRLENADATMYPGPLQRPRPPLTLAAHGPVTMQFVARHADSWNQLANSARGGDHLETAAACLEAVRSRNAQMDDFCAAVGREPKTLRRSILAGGGVTPDMPWSSPEAFCDFVGRYQEAGVNEFIFYYPSRVEQADGHYQRIAREVMPPLRQAAASL